MRRVALVLAALGVMVFTADVVVARPPSRGAPSHMSPSRSGPYGHSGYYGSRYGGSHGYSRSRYGHHGGPMIIRPPAPAHPTIILPFPGHPPIVHPPLHSRYRYYSPYQGFSYRGRGFGFSITF